MTYQILNTYVLGIPIALPLRFDHSAPSKTRCFHPTLQTFQPSPFLPRRHPALNSLAAFDFFFARGILAQGFGRRSRMERKRGPSNLHQYMFFWSGVVVSFSSGFGKETEKHFQGNPNSVSKGLNSRGVKTEGLEN